MPGATRLALTRPPRSNFFALPTVIAAFLSIDRKSAQRRDLEDTASRTACPAAPAARSSFQRHRICETPAADQQNSSSTRLKPKDPLNQDTMRDGMSC